jgi:hypothetical protein
MGEVRRDPKVAERVTYPSQGLRVGLHAANVSFAVLADLGDLAE